MQQLSFKNRIAKLYIISTALLIAVVFIVVYFSASFSVYSHVNDDIETESAKHLTEIVINKNHFHLIRKEEWMEREHNTVDVNPVFVQFIDIHKQLVEKSPNLKHRNLRFNSTIPHKQLFDYQLEGKSIRQIQLPIYFKKNIVGYLMVAMSLENSHRVLNDLLEVLLIAFPTILVVLFLIARVIAGRSIKPINTIMATSNAITKDNLKSRIPLPKTKDELYVLSKTINSLLDRLENAIEREKQFTSDASHELRTPLTIIKGTLEVLIRKPRTALEYEEKINFCITEVDHLNHLVGQLLLLARYENQKQSLKIEPIHLNELFIEAITRQTLLIESKKIEVVKLFKEDFYCESDHHLLSIVINNIISNALKYSNTNGIVEIQVKKDSQNIRCVISDNGIGIAKADLEKIFQPFFRSNHIASLTEIKGVGIGLSIVQRLCSLLSIELNIVSKEGVGTKVTLIIPRKDLSNS